MESGNKGKAKKSIRIIPFPSRNLLLKQSEEDDHKPLKNKSRVSAKGFFPVYVGEEKKRFVMKTEMANHAVFKKMLEEAEREYGFSNGGHVLLPCHVDVFYGALSEMEKESSGLLCGSFSFLIRPFRRRSCGR